MWCMLQYPGQEQFKKEEEDENENENEKKRRNMLLKSSLTNLAALEYSDEQ